ncbi:MAG: gamma-glutamylcyclotransferase [Candidatus Colwellbacteria bacterium]|nr:gamma-glutamylcyclotransferase [Candidatus Colwellbacteria bacterium]
MYYFAYGSNMNEQQMLKRCPESHLYGKGVLKNYSLDFTIYEEGRWNGGGCADVVYTPGAEVWGLVYSVSSADAKNLDIAEGVPYSYRRINKIIEVDDGKNLEAFLYEVVNKAHPKNPSTQYLDIIKRATEKYQFPKTYRDFIKAIKPID